MRFIFSLLASIIFICLIVGLIKPALFSRWLGVGVGRKKVLAIFGGSYIILVVISAAIWGLPKGTPSAPEDKPEEVATVDEPVKTEQQILEENLAKAVIKLGGSDMSYRGLELEKSDSGRPTDTQMVTVSVNVKDFFSKNSLLRHTGELSSQLFRDVYAAQGLKAYDVIVWYYGTTTDRYGETSDKVVLTYVIDKATYEKIDWENFNDGALCEFLEQEARLTKNFDTACNVLANIK